MFAYPVSAMIPRPAPIRRRSSQLTVLYGSGRTKDELPAERPPDVLRN